MSQIQITDLIGEAVANATERRKQGMANADLADLNDQDLNSITGGASLSFYSPIIAGFFPPPQIVGLIALPILKA